MEDMLFWIGVGFFVLCCGTCELVQSCNKTEAYKACIGKHAPADCKDLKP